MESSRKGEMTAEQMSSGLRGAVLARKLFPLLCAAGGVRNIGAQTILNAVIA